MPAPTRHIGGHPWHAGAPKLPQETVHLTREEVTALRSQDRLRRLNQEAKRGTWFQLLDSRGNKAPVVLITGVDPAAVHEAKIALFVLLHHGVEGLVVPLHLSDVRKLQGTRCEILAEIEEKSGCRIVLEDHREDVKRDRNIGQKQPFARLLGTQPAQACAVDLLARVCQQHVVSETVAGKLAGNGRALVLQTFDPIKRGENVDMTEDHRIARSRRTQGCWNPSHCVVAGMGAMDVFSAGAFFCLGVRGVESDRQFRGGTRFGISPMPVAMPLPDSLLFEPHSCWVLGRGLARSPGGQCQELHGASFDHFQEGDELGLLVTSQRGSVAVLHRPQGRQWTCLVHWDAKIPEPRDALFVLVDLAGGLVEVDLRQREPPLEPLGDAVSLPLRAPDRSQRYPQPRRIQLAPAEEVATGTEDVADGDEGKQSKAGHAGQEGTGIPEAPQLVQQISDDAVRSQRLVDRHQSAMSLDPEALPALVESEQEGVDCSTLPTEAPQETGTNQSVLKAAQGQQTHDLEEDLVPTLLGESLIDRESGQ